MAKQTDQREKLKLLREMNIYTILQLLNESTPSREEIIRLNDGEIDDELINSLTEELSYKENDNNAEYDSFLYSLIHNTDIQEKGIADFNFIPRKTSTFLAYNKYNGDELYLIDKKVYLENSLGKTLMSCSEIEFAIGMVASFKANMDFSFRKSSFNKDKIWAFMSRYAQEENLQYFISMINEAYPE